MSRIVPLSPEQAAPEIRAVFDSATRRLGRLPTPLGVTAHHRDLFHAYAAYEQGLARARLVDARLKSLATIKVAALVGCPF